MTENISRRSLLATAGLTAALGVTGKVSAQDASEVLVVGVACSPRKGQATATGMAAALEAAAGVDPRIRTKLLDLGGMRIHGSDGSSSAVVMADSDDDFHKVVEVLDDPNLCGLMIGSPSYFRSLSALCKAFLERLAVFRTPNLQWVDLPVGALAVGSYRNGGQELVIDQILTAMLCHEAVLVGGKPRAHQGATLWTGAGDSVSDDELGMESARNLGIRVAEAALKYKATR